MVIFHCLIRPLNRLQILIFVVLLFEVALLLFLVHGSRIHLFVVEVAVAELVDGQLVFVAVVLDLYAAVVVLSLDRVGMHFDPDLIFFLPAKIDVILHLSFSFDTVKVIVPIHLVILPPSLHFLRKGRILVGNGDLPLESVLLVLQLAQSVLHEQFLTPTVITGKSYFLLALFQHHFLLELSTRLQARRLVLDVHRGQIVNSERAKAVVLRHDGLLSQHGSTQ